MRTRSKLLLAGLSATLLLSLAVTSASARDFESSATRFRLVWTRLDLRAGGTTVSCPVTLEGSYHSATIHKVRLALIGHMTRGTVVGSACTGGSATVNQEALPWHIKYRGFRGRLPRIEGVVQDLVGAKFTVFATSLNQTCTTITTTERPAIGIVEIAEPETGVVTGTRADETASIPLMGNFFCQIAGNGTFAGTARTTVLGAATAITVRLI